MSDQNMSAADIFAPVVAEILAKPVLICLTTLRAERCGQWTKPLTALEVRLLNVLLTSNAFEATRTTISETLWPGSGKKTASKNVEVLLSRLRRKLEPLDVAVRYREPDCYQLVFDDATPPNRWQSAARTARHRR